MSAGSAVRAPVARDRRRASRRRAILSGVLVHSPSNYTTPCAILDISQSGARVRLPPGQTIGTPMYLADLSHGLAFATTLAWRRADRMGLRFDAYYDLAKRPRDPAPALLHRLWIDRQSR
jgi:hypothetical protein